MKNKFIKIGSNKKNIYFIYRFEMSNINNIFPFQKEIHCIYDKTKQKLKGYYLHIDNKLHNIMNLSNVLITDIIKNIEDMKPDIEKKILLIMTTLVLSNSVVSADIIKSFNTHKDINYIESQMTYQNDNKSKTIINVAGGTQLTNNEKIVSELSSGIYEGLSVIDNYKEVNVINDKTKLDRQILLTFDRNNNTIREISKNLNLNIVEESNLKNGSDNLINGFAFETQKEGIYLGLNNLLVDKYKNNPEELKEISKILKTITIHEGFHNVKGDFEDFKLGGEAFSVYSQLKGEKINFNSNFVNDLANYAKVNEINSMMNLENSIIFKHDKNTSEDITKLQTILITSMFEKTTKYVSSEELSMEDKKELLNYLSNERSVMGKNFVNYNEYLQTIHPNDLEYGLEGGFIHNFAKILIDKGQTPLEAFQNLEKLNNNQIAQYIAERFIGNVLSQTTLSKDIEEKYQMHKKNNDMAGFIKTLYPNFYYKMMKNISLAMYDSCEIYDKDGSLKQYYENKIKTDPNFLLNNEEPNLENEYILKNKLLELFNSDQTIKKQKTSIFDFIHQPEI
jgi:hypothetical protein